MLTKLKNALKLSTLAASVLAATMSVPSVSVAAVAAFAENAVNTGVLAPQLLGGININSQVTYPTVFVFPAENQQWFTTIRTCFNPQTNLAGITLELPFASTFTTLGTGLNVNLNVGGLTGLITGLLGPVLTGTGAASLVNNVVNLLNGTVQQVFPLANSLAATGVSVTYQVYNDIGTAVGSPHTVIIPANGCDMHTSDVTSDLVFQSLQPGVYSVVVTASALQAQNIETSPVLGFLTGTANSTGRNVLKALNILK